MANALIIAFMLMLFKSEDNKISTKTVKILLQNKWNMLKYLNLGKFLII